MTRDHRDVSSPNRINCFRTNQRLFYELTARWIRRRWNRVNWTHWSYHLLEWDLVGRGWSWWQSILARGQFEQEFMISTNLVPRSHSVLHWKVSSYPDLTLFYTEKWARTQISLCFTLAVGDLGTRLHWLDWRCCLCSLTSLLFSIFWRFFFCCM